MVLDSIHRVTVLHIDMAVVLEEQIFVVWHHIRICVSDPSVVPPFLNRIATLFRTSPSIERVAILRHFSFGFVIFWEIVSAVAIPHAWQIAVSCAARTMEHEITHCLKEWICDGFCHRLLGCFIHHLHINLFIRDFCTDNLIQLSFCQVTFAFKPNNDVHVREPSFLKFNRMRSCNSSSKNIFGCDVFNELLFL